MHEPVSMHVFFSAYVCCFVLLRFYHTAVWHYGMRLIIFLYLQGNVLPFMEWFDNYDSVSLNLSSKGVGIFV